MRRAQPKEGIEYTFRFHKNGKTSFTTLTFETTNEKGRLVFYNKQSKAFTSMKPERFSYIHRFNLVREKPIETAPVQIRLKEVDPRLIEDVSIIEPSNDKYAEYHFFKDVTPEQRKAIEETLPISYTTFLRMLKTWETFSTPAEEIAYGNESGIRAQWQKACNIVGR